jgi:microcompartment protein CcmL/EutN
MSARNSIGIIELTAIHKGFEAQDAILKHSNADKLLARTICSGKYLILVRGGVADVRDALRVAQEAGSYAVVNAVAVDNVDPAIFPAIVGNTLIESPRVDAVLVVESFSVASVIKAADLAVKAGNATLLRIHVAMAIGGKGYFVLTGNIDSLRACLEPALEFLKNEGTLVGTSLITMPHKDVLREMI